MAKKHGIKLVPSVNNISTKVKTLIIMSIFKNSLILYSGLWKQVSESAGMSKV